MTELTVISYPFYFLVPKPHWPVLASRFQLPRHRLHGSFTPLKKSCRTGRECDFRVKSRLVLFRIKNLWPSWVSIDRSEMIYPCCTIHLTNERQTCISQMYGRAGSAKSINHGCLGCYAQLVLPLLSFLLLGKRNILKKSLSGAEERCRWRSTRSNWVLLTLSSILL